MACVVSIFSKVPPGLSGAAVTSATSKVTGARKFISHRNEIIVSLNKQHSLYVEVVQILMVILLYRLF